MITPEYCKSSNCPVCGWRCCPGCDDPPEVDDELDLDPYEGDPEALGWQRATTEDLYMLPKPPARVYGDRAR